MEDIEFTSAGQVCRGWRLVAPHDALDGRFGRPVVVMAHGIGGTIDSGLRPFADMLCAIGVDVVAFDYRGFGVSGGRPRQRVSMRCQIGDYHAAVEMAQRLPGIDRDRVVLWGVSLAGGHVINVAACRSDIAGVIALTPLVDGCAAAALALRHHSAGSMVRGATTSLKSAVATLRGADPVSMTLVGRPGCAAALSLDGAYDRYTALGDRRGKIVSTPRSAWNCWATGPSGSPRVSAARRFSRSPAPIAVRRRVRPPGPRPRHAPQCGITRVIISTCGPGAGGSPAWSTISRLS